MLGTMALTACQFMEEPGMAVQMRESKHPYNNNTNFEVQYTCGTVGRLLKNMGVVGAEVSPSSVCARGASVLEAPANCPARLAFGTAGAR